MTITEINSHEPKFRYQLLSRLIMDCKYFIGNGNGACKYLWAGNVEDHIKYMKGIWSGFSEDMKPEWLSMNDILLFEKKMSDM